MDYIPPEPEHRRTVSDIGDVSGPHAAGEGNEFTEGVGDNGSRVSTPAEQSVLVVVRVDFCFNRVAADALAA